MSTDRPAVSYIVIEVRERDPERPAADMVLLRNQLHSASQALGLNIADVPVRFDRDISYTGVPEPWEPLHKLFQSVFAARLTAEFTPEEPHARE